MKASLNTLNNFLKCQSQKWARVYLTYFKGNEKFFVTNCTSNNQNKLNFLFPILSCGKHKKLRHGSTLTIYWRNTVLHCPVLIWYHSVRSESFNEEYKSCVAGGGKVVSHVFCLPNSYRKDVLHPTGNANNEGQFILLTGFLLASR